jgi:hypothetical protein
VQIHEVDVPEVEDHALLASEEPVEGLAHPRGGRGVDLALDAHDRDSAEIVDRDFEWVWAYPGGQSESPSDLGANIHPVWRNGND